MVVEVKALACELPQRFGVPLSRFSIGELRREAIERGIVAEVSGSTIWRWLSEDAIKPWRHRSWIFPRDPEFETKAGRVLDLYHREWEGKRLSKRDFVICADEKTSIQARIRRHSTLPVHANWLNQIEIYFSVVQRKVLTPNDFASLEQVEDRLLAFQDRYQETASPFEWRFTRKDLERLMDRLDGEPATSAAAA